MSSGLRFLLGFAFAAILLALLILWPEKEKPRNRSFKQPTFASNPYGLGPVVTKKADLPPDASPDVPPLP